MKLAALLIVVLHLSTADAIGEQRIISIGGPASSSGTLHIGVAPLGSSAVSPLLAGSFSTGDSPYTVRDSLMPIAGIAGVGKRATLVVNANFIVGLQMFHSDAFQYWASFDGTNWSVLPEAEELQNMRLMDGFYGDPRANGPTLPRRRILMSGNSSSNATFYLGTTKVGSSAVTSVLSGSLIMNEAANANLRDRMMPPEGIPGFGKRGAGAVHVFHPDTIQFWASVDGSNWTLIGGPNDPEIRVNGVAFLDIGSNGSGVAVSNVPAISAWGLAVLVLVLLVMGSVIMRARSRVRESFLAPANIRQSTIEHRQYAHAVDWRHSA